MKRFSTFAILLALPAAALLSGCSGESASPEGTVPESGACASERQSVLVSYALKSSVPAAEAVDSVLAEFEPIEAPCCFDIDLEEVGIQLKAYRIVYNTVDVKGEPVSLSGDVCYIDGGLSGMRILESVSLFHPAFATSEEHCCEYEQYAFIGRSVHNALVVYPHYQGFFEGRDLPVTVSESLLKARQAIDCELAALELIEELDNVTMSPLWYTENIGISCGTGAALATHWLLEQEEEMKALNKEYIRLRGTYCCEGPYRYSDLITYFVDDFPYEDLQDVEDFSQVALIALVVGTYDTWKGVNGHFEGVDDVKSYFNPELFRRDDLYDGDVKVEDLVGYFREGRLDHHTKMFKNIGLSSKEMINPDFMVDGSLDLENTYVKALYSAMAENEVIAGGWCPKAPLTISHSLSDELVPYSQALSVYVSLSRHGLNPLVTMHTIPGLEHTNANIFYALRDILIKKHPCD